MRERPRSLMTGAAVLAALACGGEGAAVGTTVADSAGVRIVTNTLPAVPGPPAWRVDTIPSVVVGRGADDGAELLMLPVGVARLSDGRIVVADRGSFSIKYFRPDGTLDFAVGRQGSGPGEYEYIARLHACGGDSVWVDDIVHRRVFVHGPDGRQARSLQVETPESGVPPFDPACGRQGHWVAAGWGARTGPPTLGVYRPEVPLSLSSPNGNLLVTFGTFQGTERMGHPNGSSPQRMGRWLRYAIGPDVVWVADNTTADILGFGLDGTLRTMIRTPQTDRPVTAADLEWHRTAYLDSAPNDDSRSRRAEALEAWIPPKAIPAVERLLVDAAGLLWVQRYPEPHRAEGVWDVYRADGRHLARLDLPVGLQVREIGTDYVLGLATGEDGAIWVQQHALRR